ncbi:MAG: hypothetical protein HYV47_01540 [Candidatus Nealsonbacteria bacterium]|nr:hypothetical protein [Candidatus Nealsonbacteria bacterium]
MKQDSVLTEMIIKLLIILYKIFIFWPIRIIIALIYYFILYPWLAAINGKGIDPPFEALALDDMDSCICALVADFFVMITMIIMLYQSALWAPLGYFIFRLFSYLVPLAYCKVKEEQISLQSQPKPQVQSQPKATNPWEPVDIPKEKNDKQNPPINPWEKKVIEIN